MQLKADLWRVPLALCLAALLASGQPFATVVRADMQAAYLAAREALGAPK